MSLLSKVLPENRPDRQQERTETGWFGSRDCPLSRRWWRGGRLERLTASLSVAFSWHPALALARRQAHGCDRSGAARRGRRGREMNLTDWDRRVPPPPAIWPPSSTPGPSTAPSVPYVVSEVLVGAAAVVGNAAVLVAFVRERRLRRRTNYYIVSLAAADLLVGALGVPFAVMASLGLPSGNLHACLFTVSLLVVLCTTSIFCLVAVSVDRYWAILHPLGYSRIVSTRMAIGE